jgi:hypothetical protein
MLQQSANIETGSNTILVDISHLTKGTFIVKLVYGSNAEVNSIFSGSKILSVL